MKILIYGLAVLVALSSTGSASITHNFERLTMQKIETSVSEIKLVGITARTNNKQEMDPATGKIGPVVQKYFHQQLAAQIPHRSTPGVTYCVYTEYESDYTGDYTYFIGEKVDSVEGVPADFKTLTIPAQTYAIFTAGPAPMPDVIRNAWMDIWKKSDADFGGKRAYVADFELYDERASNPNAAVIDIYIGIRK